MRNIIVNGTPFSEYEAKIKLLVLSYSLKFESLASDLLSLVLSIDRSSKSIGNTSYALSMNQKVTLLLDTKLFAKTDKESIKQFQEIRNQFMHNASAKSFEICFSYISGAEKVLERAYLAKKEENEKAGGERAMRVKADDEFNKLELQSFNISDKEKLLYKYWISLTDDVIDSFEKALL